MIDYRRVCGLKRGYTSPTSDCIGRGTYLMLSHARVDAMILVMV